MPEVNKRVIESVEFTRRGEGVDFDMAHDGTAITTHYTYEARLGYDGSTVTERTSEHSHPFDEPCSDCAKWL